MNTQTKKIASITLFYLIAISLRYYIAIIKPDFLSDLSIYLQILALGVGPLIGGLIVVKFLNRPNFLSLFSLGFWRTIAIIAIPVVLFSLVGILKTGVPYFTAPKIAATILLYALFEEFGWRGYLQSELSGMKNIYKYLIITVLWFVWHLNFELSINNLLFFLLLFGGSYGIGLMADKSKSLVVAALFHSYSNLMQTELFAEIEFNYKLIIIVISGVATYFIVRNSKNVISKKIETQLA
jgi:membrane protease YdiL (CAAX protease family)